ncbi:DUF4429 domain-containing protein [Pseudarthrobacter sp. NIBRBAC000502770]|nr:DUF4429 domain-containing protein [Pseudarthrobacter sp. NIBRBAC000502770]
MRQQSIQWVLQAAQPAATTHILEAAEALKFKASATADKILVESPYSIRANTFAGKYTGSVVPDGDGTVVVWEIEGQGSNQPRNIEKLAEKLPAGLLVSAGPVLAPVAGASAAPGDADYRAKHGIPADSVLAVGVAGYCAFDGQFVTIQHVGALGRMTVGKGAKRVPLASITGVQIKPAGPLVNGFIQFTLPGGNERRSSFGRQTTDAASDENSIVFNRSQEASFLAFRDAVEQAITARHNPATPATTAATAPSILDQIAQMASLRDAGVLTDEEFEAKKAELLKRL